MSEVVLRIVTLERHDWFKHKDGSGRGKTKWKNYVVEKFWVLKNLFSKEICWEN